MRMNLGRSEKNNAPKRRPKIGCFQKHNRYFWDHLNFGTTLEAPIEKTFLLNRQTVMVIKTDHLFLRRTCYNA